MEPAEPAVRYPLTDAERDVVERVVMAEAGGESFEGQMLVAQCILNAAEKRGVDPSEAVVHESQIFVIEEGGHRFFAERSTR